MGCDSAFFNQGGVFTHSRGQCHGLGGGVFYKYREGRELCGQREGWTRVVRTMQTGECLEGSVTKYQEGSVIKYHEGSVIKHREKCREKCREGSVIKLSIGECHSMTLGGVWAKSRNSGGGFQTYFSTLKVQRHQSKAPEQVSKHAYVAALKQCD